MIEIWTFGAEQWGEARADEYAAMLRHVAMGLLEFPRLGPSYAGRHAEFRSIKAGAHRIVYRLRDERIEIARVFHSRMDPKRHLG
ncbi:MAG: type II toxin-antitoxin system RelE/ParE family toxin [Sphingosinicella sp.]|uniref:type II toxin-antitoxin system RelE/ParE family toxin n=1 Tax=Sphingosinicella sp. TaxID=1917971 RepID=UPI004037DDC7